LEEEMVRPWDSDIDDKIFWFLLLKQDKKKPVMKHGVAVDIEITTMSYTELYQAVARKRKDNENEKKKGLSPETFNNHLERLVEKLHMLRKYPKAKGKREVYGFDKKTYLKMHNNTHLSPEELDRRRLKLKYGLT
jgi:hypothetical protein